MVPQVCLAFVPAWRNLLIRLYRWLDLSDELGDADLVFALAGRDSRKIFAFEVFSVGRTSQLLLSVGRFEIRRFPRLVLPGQLDLLPVVASVPPEQRHLFVSMSGGTNRVELIRKGRLGTLSEIRALRSWLALRTDIKSVMIVSSASHLRRVSLCCRRLMPSGVRFQLLAEDGPGGQAREGTWWQTQKTRSVVLLEFPKLLCYWVVLKLSGSWLQVRSEA